MATEKTVLSFGPELAGEQVGWVHTLADRQEDRPRSAIVAGMLARVGMHGAEVTYYQASGYKELPHATGFSEVISVSSIIDGEGSNVATTAEGARQATHTDRRVNELIRRDLNIFFAPNEAAEPSIQTPQDFLTALKAEFREHGHEQHYPAAYYQLNQRAGSLYLVDELSRMPINEWALVDPAMQEMTAVKREQAQASVLELTRALRFQESTTDLEEHVAAARQATFILTRLNRAEQEPASA